MRPVDTASEKGANAPHGVARLNFTYQALALLFNGRTDHHYGQSHEKE
jgi:hypothetical protein